jgi:hypothetical protein
MALPRILRSSTAVETASRWLMRLSRVDRSVGALLA